MAAQGQAVRSHPLDTHDGGRVLGGLRLRPALLYGLLIWVVPFVLAILIYPVREVDRPLFESAMPVALAAIVVFAAVRYFGAHPATSVWSGVVLGLWWAAMSVVLDLALFVLGPIQMPLLDYAKDIALTYMLIPVITAGFAGLRRG
jgi:hypothetical protein